MNVYKIEIALSKAVPELDFRKYKAQLAQAVDYFNDGAREKQKEASLTDVQRGSFTLSLESAQPIEQGHLRHLRRFSIYLLENSPLGQYVYNGGLFKIKKIKAIEETEEKEAIEPEHVAAKSLSRKAKRKKFENKVIVSEQAWHGTTISFDPDSSPSAWEHYVTYYAPHWQGFQQYYDGESNLPRLFEYISTIYQSLIPAEGYQYLNFPLLLEINRSGKVIKKACHRLVGVENTLQKPLQTLTRDGLEYYCATMRLGGDVDFNFSQAKCALLLRKANSKAETEILKERLKQCNEKHHALVNFSMMPVMGNMQAYKQKGLQIGGVFEHLDRLDSFFYHLDAYFKGADGGALLRHAGVNGAELKIFLSQFDDIYTYANDLYFLDGEDGKALVDRMVLSGASPLQSADDVLAYIELAEAYWQKKEAFFQKQNSL